MGGRIGGYGYPGGRGLLIEFNRFAHSSPALAALLYLVG